MKAAVDRRRVIEVLGGAMLTVVLGVFFLQGLPFLAGSPAKAWSLHRGTVTGKRIDSTDGRANAKIVRGEVRFQVDLPGEGRVEGHGQVAVDGYDAIESNTVVDVYWTGRRAVLAEDLRWERRHRMKYWLMLAATVAAFVETTRRGWMATRRTRE